MAAVASVPAWKTFDTGPPYVAFLQQAAGASVIPLTTATQVEFIAKNSGNTATSVLIHGTMTIPSAAQGMVQYAWGASDLILADTYNVEYEISWQDGTTETVPNDSYAEFQVIQDLEKG